jgi:hypothetical protein
MKKMLNLKARWLSLLFQVALRILKNLAIASHHSKANRAHPVLSLA